MEGGRGHAAAWREGLCAIAGPEDGAWHPAQNVARQAPARSPEPQTEPPATNEPGMGGGAICFSNHVWNALLYEIKMLEREADEAGWKAGVAFTDSKGERQLEPPTGTANLVDTALTLYK